jgi:hypothetical protein
MERSWKNVLSSTGRPEIHSTASWLTGFKRKMNDASVAIGQGNPIMFAASISIHKLPVCKMVLVT